MKNTETKVYDIYQQLAEPEEAIMKIMGADVVQLHRYRAGFGIDIANWKPGKLMDGSDCLVPRDFNPVENSEAIWMLLKMIRSLPECPKEDIILIPCTTHMQMSKVWGI